MNIACTVVAIVLIVLRGSGIMVDPTLPQVLRDSMKDAAHLFVGFLAGGYFLAGRKRLGILAATLTVVETVAFLSTHRG